MDANGQRFWMLADRRDWSPIHAVIHAPTHAGEPTDGAHVAPTVLQLASQRELTLQENEAEANAALTVRRQLRDRFGKIGKLLDTSIEVDGVGGPIFEAPNGFEIADATVGHDDVLYVALTPLDVNETEGRIAMKSLVGRWEQVEGLVQPNFKPNRLAADPAGGAWCLDTGSGQVGHVRGAPLPRTPIERVSLEGEELFGSHVFRPKPENPTAPELRLVGNPIANATSIDITVSAEGRVAVLGWRAADAPGLVTCIDPLGETLVRVGLQGVTRPYAVTWLNEDRVAVLVTDDTPNRIVEAPTFEIPREAPPDTVAQAHGDLFLVRGHRPADGRFVATTSEPHFIASGAQRKLTKLSRAQRARSGWAQNRHPIDGLRADTVWHRLYLEANIPPQCGLRIFLAATRTNERPAADAPEWHEHLVGNISGSVPSAARPAPRAAWFPLASEVPFHPGLLDCEPIPNQAGVFTVLVQRHERRVTALRGRFLWLRVQLVGDGRDSPELRAIRVYASRFSYRDEYLPRMYHEVQFGADADEPAAQASSADFLERFLSNIEGVLTPIEDRIANAHLLTDPQAAPDEALDWLAGWMGIVFDAGYPKERRREAIRSAHALHKWHGTLRGLHLALDIVLGGALRRNEVVVVENFRLRRTFATILGANLAPHDSELLAGLVVNSNSRVGDTLFLGDESKKEFLNLFADTLKVSKDERKTLEELDARFAHRLTVLVRKTEDEQMVGLVRRTAELHTPAHVAVDVIAAPKSFIVGISSLVGVDTYLGPPRTFGAVEVGRSRLGFDDLVRRPASLDPHLEGGAS